MRDAKYIMDLNRIIAAELQRDRERQQREDRLAGLELRRLLSDSVYMELKRKERESNGNV
jgi:hypothetical protein